MHIQKTISLLLLFCFLNFFSQAQIYNASLIDTSKKELHYDKYNNLKIVGRQGEVLTFVINEADTNQTNRGSIFYQPTFKENYRTAKVDVYHKDILIASETFTLQSIAPPIIQIGTITKSTYSMDDLIRYPKLECNSTNSNIQSWGSEANSCIVLSYKLSLEQNGKLIPLGDTILPGIDTTEITDPINGETRIEIQQRTETEYNKTHYGNTIFPKHIALLKQTQKGDKLIISNIKTICPNGQIRRLDDIILIKE